MGAGGKGGFKNSKECRPKGKKGLMLMSHPVEA